MTPSSKGMEQHWAAPQLMFDTSSGLANCTLIQYYMLPVFRYPGLDLATLVKVPQHVIRATREMA